MREHPNLIGQRFGKVVVERQLESTTNGKRRWLCRCDCGNEYISTSDNLKRRPMANCGCRKSPDLTGKVFGRLTVLGRSEKRSPRGARTTPMWECRCECGSITYKATDTLTNPDLSMCHRCAQIYASEQGRANAGYVEGTQLGKIRVKTEKSNNLSGVRGVYFNPKKGLYKAEIKFQGKSYYLGSFKNLDDAIKARRLGEEKYFEPFLDTVTASATAQAPSECTENKEE